MSPAASRILVYTDGACDPNPGRGGWAAVLLFGTRRKEISGGFLHTTNNRMELLAVIEGLRALKKPCTVTVLSDSRYVVDAVSKGWLPGWKRKGWRRGKKAPLINADLWKSLDELIATHEVSFEWVPGHSGIEENERCDQLATQARCRPDLPEDPGYGADDPASGSLFPPSLDTRTATPLTHAHGEPTGTHESPGAADCTDAPATDESPADGPRTAIEAPGPAPGIRQSATVIFVSDLTRALAFYGDALGLELLESSTDRAVLALAPSRLVLRTSAIPAPPYRTHGNLPPGRSRLDLEVDEVDRLHTRLVGRGIRCVLEPCHQERTRMALYLDPDGMLVALREPKD